MPKLLFISASPFGERSTSRRLAREFVEAWLAAHEGVEVAERDLQSSPIPHLTAEALAARSPQGEALSREERERRALWEAELQLLESADVLVIAAPMINFTIPSTLKAWIDQVVVAGRTFRFGPAGSEGLLQHKKVFVVSGRSGSYSGDASAAASDHYEPYLRCILSFIGLTEVTFIPVDWQGRGPEGPERGVALARDAIRSIVAASTA